MSSHLLKGKFRNKMMIFWESNEMIHWNTQNNAELLIGTWYVIETLITIKYLGWLWVIFKQLAISVRNRFRMLTVTFFIKYGWKMALIMLSNLQSPAVDLELSKEEIPSKFMVKSIISETTWCLKFFSSFYQNLSQGIWNFFTIRFCRLPHTSWF